MTTGCRSRGPASGRSWPRATGCRPLRGASTVTGSRCCSCWPDAAQPTFVIVHETVCACQVSAQALLSMSGSLTHHHPRRPPAVAAGRPAHRPGPRCRERGHGSTGDQPRAPRARAGAAHTTRFAQRHALSLACVTALVGGWTWQAQRRWYDAPATARTHHDRLCCAYGPALRRP